MSEFPEVSPLPEPEQPDAALDNFRAKAGALSTMISSPGWAETRMILRGRLKMLVAGLIDPTRERVTSDDYLRGQIEALTLMLKTPLALLESYAKIVRDGEEQMVKQRTAEEPTPWAARAAELGIRMAGFPDSDEEGTTPEGS